MSWRINLALLVILIAGVLYVLLVERHQLSTRDVQGREGTVLPQFVVPHIKSIVLVHKEQRLVVEQQFEDGEGTGTWDLVQPAGAPLNKAALDDLVAILEWSEPLRVLHRIDDADRHRFGLDRPVLSVRFEVRQRWHELLVGSRDVRGQGQYVAVDDRDTVLVVGHEFHETLARDISVYTNTEHTQPGIGPTSGSDR